MKYYPLGWVSRIQDVAAPYGDASDSQPIGYSQFSHHLATERLGGRDPHR